MRAVASPLTDTRRRATPWLALVAVVATALGATTSACSLVMSIDALRTGDADAGLTLDGEGGAGDAGLSLDGGDGTDASGALLRETFETFPLGETWSESTAHGAWLVSYVNGGSATIELDGTHVLSVSPKPPAVGQSQSALVRTTRRFGDVDITVRVKTVAQLRAAAPDPTEVAQILWDLDAAEDQCYYLLLRATGWEIGRKQLVSSGQQVLASGGDAYPVGQWFQPRIQHKGTTIRVWLDTATSAPPQTITGAQVPDGTIGLYVDDAHARFDDVVVVQP